MEHVHRAVCELVEDGAARGDERVADERER
jgi:hypothetical protein